MSVSNQEVAKRLHEIYQLMQLAGENRFRAIAFDRAAQTIEGLGEDINTYIEQDNLTDIKGIGNSIAEDIKSYASTGKIDVLEDLRQKIPSGVIEWLDISGLGPKNIAKIHKELGISDLEELKEACLDGRVASLDGLGEKSAEKIVKSIEWMEQHEERCRLDQATEIAEPLFNFLKELQGVEDIEVAGSLRRSLETIGDVDILVGAEQEHAPDIFDAFVEHDLVVDILGRGDTKSSIRTSDGRQVDLRIVKPAEFPAALMYFTGSKEHNVVMRQRARERGMSLNEYGLFKLNDEGDTDFEQPVEYGSETDIYRQLDLHFVPPELREDRGEFDYFEDHEEMELLEEDDIRGVIHAHSTYSDGKYSIRQIAEACIERGYEYLGLTDHSQTAAYAGGLSPDEVKKQWEEVDELNEEFKSNGTNFRIFKGIESDILGDGSLDYEDELLDGFEFVIASVHSGMEMSKSKMMERFRNAIKNPYTRIVGHPTGRLLLKRDGSDLDMNELIELAAEYNTAIEINANPMRLELDWRHGNKAREVGLISSINPDAHSIKGIDYIKYGVKIARKGKFGKDRILNAKSADDVAEFFRNR
ncbi:DNA polymerase/3'-5' exonuclease PolX [Aliifodinibius sp. S!AR15-10]|uniref:DNA polymerase/3'-5' exonuclease PolX n=1 Tax=Aliifodinibius sp. S!AR15-10 TaxID=2950437 RepID=UPI002861090B|nr:DNA polymerase/3'-5' exonuclease PolX [Aliifodinibius sp. S!AR15-10]MDR8392879.1 DNA polymerase/3'-5' exonuclease PolX [Aliifodinibius sp. S!AR15-10]